jgi:COX assembly mitochondrial protein 1
MLQYQNQEELDAARQEWFAGAAERKAAREEHARKLQDARDKHKEWWNLDDQGRLVGKKAEEAGLERLRRKEENRVDDRGVTRGGIYRGT